MKRLLLCFVSLLLTQSLLAQLTPEDRYLKLCRVWGYLKYFHDGPGKCAVNWDSVLVANIPAAKNATTAAAFNKVLQDLFDAAGPMSLPTTPATTVPAGYNTNLNLAWFNDPVFNPSIKARLDTVKSRFRPHKICNVTDNSTYTVTGKGYIYFNDESALNSPTPAFPDAANRVLVAFRFWNYVEYFFNSIGLADQPWHSSLGRIAVQVDSATSVQSYHLSLLELIAGINDSHSSGSISGALSSFFGSYYPPFICTYTGNKVVVLKSYPVVQPQIQAGDVISMIDGIPVDTLISRRKKYIPHSNISSLRRDALMGNKSIFAGPPNSTLALTVEKASGTATVAVTRNVTSGSIYSLITYTGPEYTVIRQPLCTIGYVNMGKLHPQSIGAMYDSVKACDALVFDIRNYPQGTAYGVTSLLSPYTYTPFAKFNIPSTTYPGILKQVSTAAVTGNLASPYTGRIYVLVNEMTQSQAEFSAMMLHACADNVKVIGSQTAGADGNITTITLPGGLYSVFSTLGVLYPDGQTAQRTGVKIDYTVSPSVEGIRNGRDEFMEFVLDKLENCQGTKLSESHLPRIAVYPNPFSDGFEVVRTSSSAADLKIFDATGRLVHYEKIGGERANVRAEGLSPGVYVMELREGLSVARIRLIAN